MYSSFRILFYFQYSNIYFREGLQFRPTFVLSKDVNKGNVYPWVQSWSARSAQHAPVRFRSAWITPNLQRAPNKPCAFQLSWHSRKTKGIGYFTVVYVVKTQPWAYQSPQLRNCLGSQRASIRKAGMLTGLRVGGALHQKTTERVSEIRSWLYRRVLEMSPHTRTHCPPAPVRRRRNASRPGGPKRGIKIKSFSLVPGNCSNTGEWSVLSFIIFFLNICHGNLWMSTICCHLSLVPRSLILVTLGFSGGFEPFVFTSGRQF